MGWWSSIWKQRASEWTFASLEPTQVPDALESKLINPNSAYIDLFLRSMRIVHVRKGLKKLYGTVHSYISLPHIEQGKADFHVLTTPGRLKDIDARNINEVVSLNHRLLGPVPYRGGDIDIELGLFSIKSVDLAGPFLNVLETVAAAAGVSYVNAALPFASPIIEGMNMLAGAGGDSILEIGLATTFAKPRTGCFLVMRAQKGTVNISNLKLEKDYRLVYKTDGRPVDEYPYMVFSIYASEKRSEWFKIPELATAYSALKEDVRKGRLDPAKESFAVFKRTALTCPDLLNADARSLVNNVDAELSQVLGASLTGATNLDIRPLHEIDLYP